MAEPYSPSFVAKAGFLNAPMIGWFAGTVFDCVSVDNSAEIAAAAAAVGEAAPSYGAVSDARSGGATAAIRARLARLIATNRSPGLTEAPLTVFAEGTTTNGQYLINFRTGALHTSLGRFCDRILAYDLPLLLSPPPPGVFRAAAATMQRADNPSSVRVHSMVLRYPHRHFSPAWESIFVTTNVVRLLTQFGSTLRVDYLAPVELCDLFASGSSPSGDDVADDNAPARLATAMRHYMSTGSSMPVFEAGAAEKVAFHAWLGPRMMGLTAFERLMYTHPPTAPRP